MSLEVGKKYITFNGAIVTVDDHITDAEHYAFMCTVNDDDFVHQEVAFTLDGFYWSSKKGHKWNIVSEAPFKLEAGKTYKTRNGLVTTPLAHDADVDHAYRFRGLAGGTPRTWTIEGKWLNSNDGDHENDLVEEYLEEEDNVVQLKAGIKYTTRAGDTVMLHDCGSETSLEGDNGYYYSYAFGGFVFDDEETQADIVGLAPEPLDEMVGDFNSQQEIWKWLVEGFKVIAKETKIIFWFNNGQIRAKDHLGERDTINIFSDINAYEKYREPPKWHEFKTKAQVLCDVEDSIGNTDITLVVSFDGTTYRDTTGKDWLFAKPVSLDDMTKYIWECE
jgi:hypothetical protein